MLPELFRRIKTGTEASRMDLAIGGIVVLVGFISFGLGRLSVIWAPREPVRVITPEFSQSFESSAVSPAQSRSQQPAASLSRAAGEKAMVVASKSGAAYHLPDCPGAKKIKPENLITFQNTEEAKQAGYRPAGNCPGLAP